MPQKKSHVMHVISNTHWDREWLKTYQYHRMLLKDYLEKLMDIFDSDPGYRHYHLDSQTIPLEDYATVAPENVSRLKKYIRRGRLLVGPWYTLPEMNVIDGESIVRNLLIGHKVAGEWGRVMKVGYTPMSSGQISQLPQIYRGFGIDSALFYRGINRDAAKLEFKWRSPDGSEVISVQFPDGRAIFWAFGMLPVVYGMWSHLSDTWKYTWKDTGTPYRIDNEQEYYELNPPDMYNPENIIPAMVETKEKSMEDATSRHLIYMDGHDQSPAYPEIPRLIRETNLLMKGDRMIHSSLPYFISCLKKDAKHLKTVDGEMRLTKKSGRPGFAYLHTAILSTRLYIKQANRQSENKLIHWAEPMATVALTLGQKYPASFLEQAWKTLLANHAHDDINGCSIDKVHEDMMYRFSEVKSLSDEIARRSIAAVIKNIQPSGSENCVRIAAFNSLPFERSEVIKAMVDFPRDTGANGVIIYDGNGMQVPVQLISACDLNCSAPRDGFIRGFPVRRVEFYLQSQVPALGYRVYTAEPELKPAKIFGQNIAVSEKLMENEFLKVEINSDGTFNLTEKSGNRVFKGLHYFSDTGESGNAWQFMAPEKGPVVTSLGKRARIKLIENGLLLAKIEIKTTLKIPADVTADFKSRSKTRKNVEITSVLILSAGTKRLDISTTLDNTVKSHYLRTMFPSDVKTDTAIAEMQFDVVKRRIPLPSDAGKWLEKPAYQQPQAGFAGVSDGKTGLAVINEGLTEYSVVDDKRRTIALTLLRCFYQGSLWDTNRWPDMGYQCQGRHNFRYAVYPLSGNPCDTDIFRQVQNHNIEIKTAQSGNSTGSLPLSQSFLSVTPGNLVMSAFKKSESGNALILRLFNPTRKKISGRIEFYLPLKSVRLLNLNEEPLKKLATRGSSVRLPVLPGKIVTLGLQQSLKHRD